MKAAWLPATQGTRNLRSTTCSDLIKAERWNGQDLRGICWGFDQNAKGEILLAGHTRNTPLSKNLDVQMKVLNKDGETQWKVSVNPGL